LRKFVRQRHSGAKIAWPGGACGGVFVRGGGSAWRQCLAALTQTNRCTGMTVIE